MEPGVSQSGRQSDRKLDRALCRVLIYMLGSGGTSPFWAGNNAKTQRKILKAKFTTKIKAFEQLSEQIKQLIKRSVEASCNFI